MRKPFPLFFPRACKLKVFSAACSQDAVVVTFSLSFHMQITKEMSHTDEKPLYKSGHVYIDKCLVLTKYQAIGDVHCLFPEYFLFLM